jgi:hypothetical protein
VPGDIAHIARVPFHDVDVQRHLLCPFCFSSVRVLPGSGVPGVVGLGRDSVWA